MISQISKVLTANDLGLTGSHQAGILVPKNDQLLSFFPQLDPATLNPRTAIEVQEKTIGEYWTFQFIYYNNKLFGKTRNEYRLTGMTQFLRAIAANPGDTLLFSREEDGLIQVWLSTPQIAPAATNRDAPLILSGNWTVIIQKAKRNSR